MSGLLLDTNVLLWHAASDPKLSLEARERIRCDMGVAYVSVVSVWEIAIKVGLGKLKLDMTVTELIGTRMKSDGIELLPISEADLGAYSALGFPNPKHRDPFDRMLVVQAGHRDLTLLTSDVELRPYGPFVDVI